MPSRAIESFNDNAKDVVALLDTFEGVKWTFAQEQLDPPARLDVLFRSATVLMVSHWEAYVEDIVSEALDYLVTSLPDATVLPVQIKKLVAKELSQDLNEIAAWKLADSGWRSLLKKRLHDFKQARDKHFNTPKAQQTADFIEEVLGITDVRHSWTFGGFNPTSAAEKLNALIEVRGQIAHRGKVSTGIDAAWVRENTLFLQQLVQETERWIRQQVSSVTGAPSWT